MCDKSCRWDFFKYKQVQQNVILRHVPQSCKSGYPSLLGWVVFQQTELFSSEQETFPGLWTVNYLVDSVIAAFEIQKRLKIK